MYNEAGCPDGGMCWHDCADGECFRVHYCEPFSDTFPEDEWPQFVVDLVKDPEIRLRKELYG